MQEIRFAGGAVLRPRDSQLLVEGRPAQLGGRALEVLCALAERPGELLSKRELMDRVWPGLVVEENNLQVQISTLRRVLGPASILTVAGRGYRLVTQEENGLSNPGAPRQARQTPGSGQAAAPIPPASATSALSSVSVIPLLERQQALQALGSALDAALAGAGAVCLVYGEAGIGKSSLCNAFVARLEQVRVLRGGCEALFSPRPLGPLHDFVGQLDADARRLLGAEEARAELFAHVLACLQRQPTVLLLEDLHWADAATLDLVKYLGRRIQGASVLMLLTYRDDELSAEHPLRQVIGDLQQAVRRIALRPLSQAAVQEMARQAGRSAEGILATTGGNPFYVTELLEAGGLPATVRDAVQARVARQPAPVKALLELTSTVPGRIEHWVVESLVDPDGSAVQEALSSGLLQSDGDALRFRHELARQAVEQSIAPHQLRRLHTRMLECLQAAAGRSTAPARLVHHAKAAGRSADVLKYAPLAADEATRRGAYREAAALCESALELADALAPEAKAAILEASASANQLSNGMTRAMSDYQQALDIWKRLGRLPDQGRVMCRMSRTFWYLGQCENGRQFAREAAALLEGSPDSVEYLEALSEISRGAMLSSHYREAIEVGGRALALAEKLQEERFQAHILNNIGAARFAIGDEAGGLPMLQRSLALATRHRDEDAAARAYINMVCQLIECRKYGPAEQLFEQSGTAFFVSYDLDVWEIYSSGWRARAHFERGRWAQAQDDASQVLGRLYPLGAKTLRIPSLLVLARLKSARGDQDANASVDEALQTAFSTGELQRIAPATALRCEALWLQGRALGDFAAEAHAALEQSRNLENPAFVDELAYWLWLHAELDAVQAADAGGARGLQIAGRWREAAQAWRQIGCPLEQGQALLQGDGPAIDEAEKIFETLGARAYLARARSIKTARKAN